MAHIENQYGDIIATLEPDGFGYLKFADGECLEKLAVGDIYKVVEDDEED